VCVTVIAPLPDGSPRIGCSANSNCKYTMSNYEEGDYENLQASIELNKVKLAKLDGGAFLSVWLRRRSNKPDVFGSIPVTTEFVLISWF